MKKAISVLIKSPKLAVNKSPNKTASKSILIPSKGIINTPNPSMPARIVFIIAS